jgi:hypothetical protein
VRYAWIDRNRLGWPVSMVCEQLDVSISGYHKAGVLQRNQTTRDAGL